MLAVPSLGVAVQSAASSIPGSLSCRGGSTLRWQGPCEAGLMGCVYWGTARSAPPHWSIPVLVAVVVPGGFYRDKWPGSATLQGWG